jgi:hypothetical protein
LVIHSLSKINKNLSLAGTKPALAGQASNLKQLAVSTMGLRLCLLAEKQ